MVKSANEAASAYERGVEAIGIGAWRDAAGATTPKEAAETLENAKETALDVNTMVSKYRQAYD